MLRSWYMVLGREMMHFLATKVLPVVVVTVTRDFWSSMDATGEDRWMLLLPTKPARPMGICCAPVVPRQSLAVGEGGVSNSPVVIRM